ncbi:hypothetical protein F4780DRAFT_784014 [Xylariomycetidae sp. FL0641]|nr:hypothetical protein F4780DRAFT_784014 [Xylariomycetidae sp. FL0641]
MSDTDIFLRHLQKVLLALVAVTMPFARLAGVPLFVFGLAVCPALVSVVLRLPPIAGAIHASLSLLALSAILDEDVRLACLLFAPFAMGFVFTPEGEACLLVTWGVFGYWHVGVDALPGWLELLVILLFVPRRAPFDPSVVRGYMSLSDSVRRGSALAYERTMTTLVKPLLHALPPMGVIFLAILTLPWMILQCIARLAFALFALLLLVIVAPVAWSLQDFEAIEREDRNRREAEERAACRKKEVEAAEKARREADEAQQAQFRRLEQVLFVNRRKPIRPILPPQPRSPLSLTPPGPFVRSWRRTDESAPPPEKPFTGAHLGHLRASHQGKLPATLVSPAASRPVPGPELPLKKPEFGRSRPVSSAPVSVPPVARHSSSLVQPVEPPAPVPVPAASAPPPPRDLAFGVVDSYGVVDPVAAAPAAATPAAAPSSQYGRRPMSSPVPAVTRRLTAAEARRLQTADEHLREAKRLLSQAERVNKKRSQKSPGSRGLFWDEHMRIKALREAVQNAADRHPFPALSSVYQPKQYCKYCCCPLKQSKQGLLPYDHSRCGGDEDDDVYMCEGNPEPETWDDNIL